MRTPFFSHIFRNFRGNPPSALSVCISACMIFSVLAACPARAAGRYDKLLRSDAARAKLTALASMEDSRNISGIKKYVGDKDPLIRLRCAEVLGRVGDAAGSVELLATLAEDSNEEVAAAGIYSLGLTMSESALEPLEKALKSGSNEMKSAALEALGISRRKEASEIIGPLLTHFHASLREKAAIALAVLGDSSAASQFAASIHDPDPDLIAQTVYALGRLGCGEFNDRMVELLGHDNLWVVMRSAEALGRLREKGAVDPLTTLLDHKDRIIRIKTAEALSRIGTNDAAEALEMVLGSDDVYIRYLALRGIAASRKDRFFDFVVPLLGDNSQMVRRSAIEAVAATDPERGRPLLLEIVRSGNVYDRMAALEFLGEISDETDRPLLVETLDGSANHLEREGAAAGLNLLENDEQFLIPVGSSGRTALDALLDAGGGEDPVVAAMAIEALAGGRALTISGRLVEIFRTSGKREDCDRKIAIITALSDLADEEDIEEPAITGIIDLLREASGEGDPRIARAAADAAQRFGVSITAEPGHSSSWDRGKYPWGEPSLPLGNKNIVIATKKGQIEIELFGDDAPNFVKSFLMLIEEGFYNGLNFHRVVPGFVIQGGCPRGDGWGDAGYFLRSQFNAHTYQRGIVGMAHSGKDTPGSQFFITQLPQPHLDGRYTIIGRVVSGMEVVDHIEVGDTFGISIVK